MTDMYKPSCSKRWRVILSPVTYDFFYITLASPRARSLVLLKSFCLCKARVRRRSHPPPSLRAVTVHPSPSTRRRHPVTIDPSPSPCRHAPSPPDPAVVATPSRWVFQPTLLPSPRPASASSTLPLRRCLLLPCVLWCWRTISFGQLVEVQYIHTHSFYGLAIALIVKHSRKVPCCVIKHWLL